MIYIIGSRESGDNDGENGEDHRGVEFPCLNYDVFWFVLLLKNGWGTYNHIHVYGQDGRTHARNNVSKTKMGIKAQLIGANQYIYTTNDT